ncbi:hypothetical protein EDB84DRAFT_1512287, partial [Lactarius hengduanensis]
MGGLWGKQTSPIEAFTLLGSMWRTGSAAGVQRAFNWQHARHCATDRTGSSLLTYFDACEPSAPMVVLVRPVEDHRTQARVMSFFLLFVGKVGVDRFEVRQKI